jgi:hypothetical protein
VCLCMCPIVCDIETFLSSFLSFFLNVTSSTYSCKCKDVRKHTHTHTNTHTPHTHTHTHTHTPHTLGRTPLDEGLANRRDLYLTAQHSQEAGICAVDGIRTRIPRNRAAADTYLRPLGSVICNLSTSEV